MFNNKKHNILVLGNKGMLGYEVYNKLLKHSSLKLSKIGTVVGIDVENDIDVTTRGSLNQLFKTSIHFDYCINCIAYTNTYAAETTKEGRELDYKLNALAPKYIAESCKYWKTKLIHISTDYVFSEKSVSAAWDPNNTPIPFKPDSEPFPSNVYGMNKLLGEKFIEEVFGKESKDYCICRTSWIYGMHNSKSFIHKFMKNVVKLAIDNKTECEMTSNEYSVPTSCSYVAQCILDAIDYRLHGIQHAVPTVDTAVSRYDFSSEILNWYNSKSMFNEEKLPLSKIMLIGVERDSYWPKFSSMRSTFADNSGWKSQLSCFLCYDDAGKRILDWAKKENGV